MGRDVLVVERSQFLLLHCILNSLYVDPCQWSRNNFFWKLMFPRHDDVKDVLVLLKETVAPLIHGLTEHARLYRFGVCGWSSRSVVLVLKEGSLNFLRLIKKVWDFGSGLTHVNIYNL